MSRASSLLAAELQLIRAITVLATEAVSETENSGEPRWLPEARVALEHVEERLIALETRTEQMEAQKLRAVRP